jgi:hypothetical protein
MKGLFRAGLLSENRAGLLCGLDGDKTESDDALSSE